MSIPQKIIKFLNKAGVKYETIKHRTVYTAYDKAATLKLPPKIIGKTLLVKMEKMPALFLIPANKNLDLQKIKKTTKLKKVDFIKERWIKKNLKGVKVGAIPPLGNLWKMPTFIDRGLLKQSKIIINAGDYNWSLKISSANLKKIIPGLLIGNFSRTKK